MNPRTRYRLHIAAIVCALGAYGSAFIVFAEATGLAKDNGLMGSPITPGLGYTIVSICMILFAVMLLILNAKPRD